MSVPTSTDGPLGEPLRELASIERQVIASRLRRLPRREVQADRRAAVLVPLLHLSGRPSVLFTVRSQRVSTHRGQVSFPGGMVDAADTSLEHTAAREFEEELGVSAEGAEPLGRYHDGRSITGVAVTPVVSYLGAWDDLRRVVPEPSEVDSVFALSLDALYDPSQRSFDKLGPRGLIPRFLAGPHPVWGLTAYLLRGLLVDGFGWTIEP